MEIYRVHVKAAKFPLLSGFFGPSISIRNKLDSDYITTNNFTGTAADDEIGIPQPLYLHNVMPVSHGFKSVGYTCVLDNSKSGRTDFDSVIILRDSNEVKHILCPAQGANHVNFSGLGWQNNSPIEDIKLAGIVTRTYLKQKTYVCYKRHGLYVYSGDSHTLTPVVLKGISDSFIDGVCSAVGLLLAYTSDTLYWSSVVDPLDFVPSLATGAGSSKVLSVRGAIVGVLPITDGFIIYTTANAVSGYYTGDIRNPWVFREIDGAAGIVDIEHVTHDSNFTTHFAWTTSGLQSIGKESATIFSPEVTDFLTCGIYEDYQLTSTPGIDVINNSAYNFVSNNQEEFSHCTNNLRQITYNEPLKINLSFIGTRYVAISYGSNEKLTHILVLDIGLRRWGKLRIEHVDCFEFSPPNELISNNVGKTFGILTKEGSIYTLDFNIGTESTDSVLLYGRLQSVRGQVATLHQVEVTGVDLDKTQLAIYNSRDGVTSLPSVPLKPKLQNKNILTCDCRITGKSQILEFSGNFNVSGLVISTEQSGTR